MDVQTITRKIWNGKLLLSEIKGTVLKEAKEVCGTYKKNVQFCELKKEKRNLQERKDSGDNTYRKKNANFKLYKELCRKSFKIVKKATKCTWKNFYGKEATANLNQGFGKLRKMTNKD